ncbi:hypothetical protein AHiyo6_10540 [Arthrobacter sp. Hiyo6]|nr:hypothetical protein AHiyo6_10540 [Arthrobacter sp. Hiyo6]
MSEVIASSEEKTGLDRRRVVKGVAWSVPIIVTAIAAPAAAASIIPASVVLGPVGAASATGTSGTLTVQAPTTFDVQTGSAFTGSSVSYTITIDSVNANQRAFVEITSASPGTGSSSIGKKLTTFTGSLPTTAGNQAIHVALAGFKYSGTITKGTFQYTVTLTVTVPGSPAIVKTSTLTITYP